MTITNTHDDKYIDEMFNDHTGLLAQLVPGYAARVCQIQLARAIDRTIEEDGVMLGDAPTGAGKSLAYLIPAIMHAKLAGKPILVVTANKALQEQLIAKDLPLIAEAFAKHRHAHVIKYQLVKGRANYLCQRELFAFKDSGMMPGLTAEEIDQAEALTAWGEITPTGDQSDAPSGVSQRTWNSFSVSGERCTRRGCAFRQTCFTEEVLEQASHADVVVTNYDLFFSKLKAGSEQMWANFGTVIFDEAHEAANIARRCFGREVGLGHIIQLATDVTKYLGDRDLAKALRDFASPFFEEVARYAINMDTPRMQEPNFIRADELIDALDDTVRAAGGNCGCNMPSSCGTCAYRELIVVRAKTIMEQIQDFVGQSEGTTAYWIDKPTDYDRITAHTVKLRAVPYRVGDLLSQLIFERYPSVICVSATMTSGGTFDFIREELGLIRRQPKPTTKSDTVIVKPSKYLMPESTASWNFMTYGATSNQPPQEFEVRGIRVASPFDFAKQAKFVIPIGIPWPIPENDHIFNLKIVEVIRCRCSAIRPTRSCSRPRASGWGSMSRVSPCRA